MIPREVLIRQWFHAGLTEKEGQALVGHIQGTKKYNLLVPYSDLPEQAKQIVRTKYAETHILETLVSETSTLDEWEKRVRAYEEQGCTRSDAQAIVDAEDGVS